MSNYGDVALNLPKSWDRAAIVQSDVLAMTVGHQNGKADVFRTEHPEEEHQFRWIDINHPTDLDLCLDVGYEFVTKDKWTARRWRWQDGALPAGNVGWNAEGKLRGLGGQYLMARPRRIYDEEMAKMQDLGTVPVNPKGSAIELADRAGVAVVDGEGRLLNKIKK